MKIEFHHINCVSKDVEGLDLFYRDILLMQPIPAQKFVRTEAMNADGYAGKLKFVTEGSRQMHLAAEENRCRTDACHFRALLFNGRRACVTLCLFLHEVVDVGVGLRYP